MQKRHFELIASVVKTIMDDETRKQIAQAFAMRISSENPRFDRAKFMKACNC